MLVSLSRVDVAHDALRRLGGLGAFDAAVAEIRESFVGALKRGNLPTGAQTAGAAGAVGSFVVRLDVRYNGQQPQPIGVDAPVRLR